MCYEVLVRISPGYPSVTGRLHTRYSPVRRSPSVSASWYHVAPRLACVRPVASVHPEPGSNSSLYDFFYFFPQPAGSWRRLLLVSYYFFCLLQFLQGSLAFFIRKRTANLRVSFLFSKKNPSFFHCCPSLPKSVCKSKNFHSYLQIFLALFLYTYNKYFYNCLQITLLYTKTFLNKKLRDVGCWAFFHFKITSSLFADSV